MEEYIDLSELCKRIPYANQTIYNFIAKKNLQLGVHYLKPSPRKLIFKWSAIVQWLEGASPSSNQHRISNEPLEPVSASVQKSRKLPKRNNVFNLINI